MAFLRHDFASCETHRYAQEPPLDCSIIAFGGREDGSVGAAELAAWWQQTTRAFTPSCCLVVTSSSTKVLPARHSSGFSRRCLPHHAD